MSYDSNNIFAKILRGEIPCKRIYENKYVLSFYDINPQKKIHALVIPKGKYIDLDDFNTRATDKEIVGLIKGISIVEYRTPSTLDSWSPNTFTNVTGYFEEKYDKLMLFQ